jgi:hypothetical protein
LHEFLAISANLYKSTTYKRYRIDSGGNTAKIHLALFCKKMCISDDAIGCLTHFFVLAIPQENSAPATTKVYPH